MVFGYYHRLNRRRQAIYRESDAIETLPLPGADVLQPLAAELAQALQQGDRAEVQKICGQLANGIMWSLKAPPVKVKVLAARPRRNWGELHGYYVPAAEDSPATITVWMRTAQHKRVVAFRSFLRTLLHEVCHHLDYELLKLEETFHTEGFYKRESSLFRQLVPGQPE